MRATLVTLWVLMAPSLGMGVAAPAALAAQERVEAEAREGLFTARDALWAGGFVLGTVALAPVDLAVAEEVRDSLFQENRWVRPAARGLDLLGFPGSLLVGGGMYLAGRAMNRPVLADMGAHTSAAIFLAEVVTMSGKSLAGRARPNRNPQNPYDFRFGRGFTGDAYQSLPSAHATAAFASAAAITSELGERWPGAAVPAGAALYGAATLVGISRLYHNEHWASDVMLGAAIGTFAGWKVVKYTHDRPENRLDRWLLGVSLVGVEGGGRVARFWLAPAP